MPLGDPSAAMVVADCLLDRGEAHWPGVGRFRLTASAPARRLHAVACLHDFPRLEVAFEAAPGLRFELERAGVVALEGFGSFELSQGRVRFRAAPALRARLSAARLRAAR